jgi:hypothetical protein
MITLLSVQRFQPLSPRSNQSLSVGNWLPIWKLPIQSEPFDPALFDGDEETDAEDVEDMRKNDIRQCTRDLLLMERAREWLLEED